MKRIIITAMAILAACSLTGCSAIDNAAIVPAENGTALDAASMEQSALAANASPEVINIEKEKETLEIPIIKTKVKEWDEDKLKAMYVDTRDDLVHKEYPSDLFDENYHVYIDDEDDYGFMLGYENSRLNVEMPSSFAKYGYGHLASGVHTYSFGEYYNDDEIALFPKEDAVNRTNALLDELGIKGYSEPTVYAITADKANADLDGIYYTKDDTPYTYEKWTADNEVYILRYSFEYNGIRLTEECDNSIGGMFVGSDIVAIVTKDDIISLQAFNILSDEYEKTGKTAAVKCTKEQALEMADKYFKASNPSYEDANRDVKVLGCEIVYMPLEDFDIDTGYVSLVPMWRVDISYRSEFPDDIFRSHDNVFINVYTGAPLTASAIY